MKLNYLIRPFFNGLCGFVLFLSAILLIKIVSSFFGTGSSSLLDWQDLLLCLVGFVLNFLIAILKYFKDRPQDNPLNIDLRSEKM